tara:strand:- start:64 stop:273 length:210 start_codon:yes stop_codon:yes gene_type:complete
MGPYSEERQLHRAEAIRFLLKNNPDLAEDYKSIWKKHLSNLALNETTYNYRVKAIYSNMNRKPLVEWDV